MKVADSNLCNPCLLSDLRKISRLQRADKRRQGTLRELGQLCGKASLIFGLRNEISFDFRLYLHRWKRNLDTEKVMQLQSRQCCSGLPACYDLLNIRRR